MTLEWLKFSTDLDFSFLEMNPFTLVNGEPYPLDMRGELDDTAAFKNFKKYSLIIYNLSALLFTNMCLIFYSLKFSYLQDMFISFQTFNYHIKVCPLSCLIYDLSFSDGETLNFLCPLVEC